MSTVDFDAPVEVEEVEVAEVETKEVEAPKGKMTVEEALQVSFSSLLVRGDSKGAMLTARLPPPGRNQEGHDPRRTRSWTQGVRQGPRQASGSPLRESLPLLHAFEHPADSCESQILNEACTEAEYVKLIEALCAE